MNPIPILLLGGAAVMIMGSKKKRGGDSDGDDDGPTKIVAFQKGTPIPSGPKTLVTQQFTIPVPGGGSDTGGSSGPGGYNSLSDQMAAALCKIPRIEREAQAKIYAKIAVKEMRKAAASKLKSKRNKFPCNDADRLSWVVDEAFRLWSQGNSNATPITAKRWVVAGAWLGRKARKHRPWNTMNREEMERSLTALSFAGGMRDVQKLNLSPCAVSIRDLLTREALKHCPGVSESPFPW